MGKSQTNCETYSGLISCTPHHQRRRTIYFAGMEKTVEYVNIWFEVCHSMSIPNKGCALRAKSSFRTVPVEQWIVHPKRSRQHNGGILRNSKHFKHLVSVFHRPAQEKLPSKWFMGWALFPGLVDTALLASEGGKAPSPWTVCWAAFLCWAVKNSGLRKVYCAIDRWWLWFVHWEK